MTRDEFVAAYMARMERADPALNEAFLARQIALPCDCGDAATCEGWAMVSNDPLSLAAHVELYVSPERLHEVPDGVPRTVAEATP